MGIFFANAIVVIIIICIAKFDFKRSEADMVDVEN